MAASSLYKSQTAIGAFLRKMKSRLGPVEGITAAAHKMARIIYFMMLRKENYRENGADYLDQIYKEKNLKYLKKRAASMGYALTKRAE